MDMRFVTGEAALTLGKALVVSDLHIGIEYRYRKDGIALPSQSERIVRRIGDLIERTRSERLVILGDVKHKVPGTSFQEQREVPAVFRGFLEKAEVDVTPGNHDGGLEDLLPGEVRLHPGTGFMLGRTWLCHGHAWPPQEFLGAERVIIGHNHAGMEFRDGLGYRWIEPVWVRGRLDPEKLSERYGEVGEVTPEVVLMPVFNEFSGYIAINRMSLAEGERMVPGPLFRSMVRGSAKVYMLDGTLLGELGGLETV